MGIFTSFPPFADIHQLLRAGISALGVVALIAETWGVRSYWHSLAVVCVLVSLIVSGIVPSGTAKGAGRVQFEHASDSASSRILATGGTRTQTELPDGIVTTRQYDALDRLTQVAISGGGGTIDFLYDAGNRLTSVVDSVSGTTTFVYDLRNRLLSETSPRGAISWTYENGGRRLTMQATGQDVVTYGYNAADRVTSITQGSRSATFEYDAQMRRSALNVSTGVRVEYAWDEASRPVGIAYFEDGAPIGDLTYEFDAASRVMATGGSLARTALPQEIADTGISTGNRLTEVDSQVLTYDTAGNLVGDGTRTYSWNSRNQLAAVTGPGVAATFSYDALGRRTAKTVNGVTTEYLHDGGSIIRETVSGGATTNVLLGLGVDETLVRYGSGSDRTTLADSLGSTISTVDDSGANDAEFTYGPFGETTSSGSSDASAPQYTGRENDGTGLYYYRARYYSPSLQRFISEDPIGFAGGTTNLYAYVGNSPTNRTDPSGLLWDIFIDFGFVIYDVVVLATDSEKNFTTNALALTADVAGIFVPFGTGFGLGVRAARAVKVANHVDDAGDATRSVFHVTPDGVVLPPASKYQIPSRYVENPHRSGSYGEVVDGKFVERLRIDPATPPGFRGPDHSHYHLNGKGRHYSPRPGDPDPGFGP